MKNVSITCYNFKTIIEFILFIFDQNNIPFHSLNTGIIAQLCTFTNFLFIFHIRMILEVQIDQENQDQLVIRRVIWASMLSVYKLFSPYRPLCFQEHLF